MMNGKGCIWGLVLLAVFGIILFVLIWAEPVQGVILDMESEPEEAMSEGPKAYLTYDDGPSEVTGELLDVLAEYDIEATFFVTAQREDCLQYIVMANDAGHLIALHSYTHKYSEIYSSSGAFWDDIDELQEIIIALTGEPSEHLRFPGGSSNTLARRYGTSIRELIDQCHEQGIEYHDWNVDTRDNLSGTVSAETIFNNVKKKYKELEGQDLVILMHDSPVNTTAPEATRLIVEFLLEEGYTFETLDEINEPVWHHID